MGRADTFLKQHRDLLDLVGKISGQLNSVALQRDAKPIVQQLAQLSGKIKVHLAMEDQSLYPDLLKHQDPEVRNTAQKFMNEMGGIANAFNEYTKKWASSQSIQNSAGEFVTDTQHIFRALGQRIQQEDNKLYPLLG